MSTSRRGLVLLVAVCLAMACESALVVPPSANLTSGNVLPPFSLLVGQEHVLILPAGHHGSWRSSDESIAVVTQSGVVTAKTPGTARIMAVATPDTVSAAVTVLANPSDSSSAPPPTGGAARPIARPNEPAGFAPLAQMTFDSLTTNQWYPSHPDNPSIVVDSTSPEGSLNVGQVKFPTGFESGSAPGGLFQLIDPYPSKPKQIYVSFWIKISTNWVGNAAGANKILYWTINGTIGGSIELLGMGGLDETNQMLAPMVVVENIRQVTEGEGASGTVSVALSPNRVPYAPASQAVRGAWNHYEVLLTLNTPGQADGSVKWWWNGRPYGDYSSRVQWTDDAGAVFENVYWSPTYGGAGPAVPADQYMWMKNLYVSGR